MDGQAGRPSGRGSYIGRSRRNPRQPCLREMFHRGLTDATADLPEHGIQAGSDARSVGPLWPTTDVDPRDGSAPRGRRSSALGRHPTAPLDSPETRSVQPFVLRASPARPPLLHSQFYILSDGDAELFSQRYCQPFKLAFEGVRTHTSLPFYDAHGKRPRPPHRERWVRPFGKGRSPRGKQAEFEFSRRATRLNRCRSSKVETTAREAVYGGGRRRRQAGSGLRSDLVQPSNG